jgi:hypothetical protein
MHVSAGYQSLRAAMHVSAGYQSLRASYPEPSHTLRTDRIFTTW